jgi:hypothetical protein
MARLKKSSLAANEGTPSDSPYSGAPWANADLFFLEDALTRGMSIEEVAGFLARTADEVRRESERLEQARQAKSRARPGNH